MIIQRLFWTCLICIPLLSIAQTQDFPNSWEGDWEGSLDIYRYNSLVDAVPMKLSIQPISEDKWTFTIQYGEGEQIQRRPYELLCIDSINGLYQIDEKNGIRLDAFYHQPCLYERFSVAGNMLTTQICRNGNKLDYEITFGTEAPHSISGDTVLHQTDTIPTVKSYNVPSIQKAILSRQ